MNKFLNNANLQNIIGIFREYMQDKFNITVPFDDALSSLALKQMRIIAANANPTDSLKELNLQVLGYLRKFYLDKLQYQTDKRKVHFNETVAASTRIGPVDIVKKMEVLQSNRDSEFARPVPPDLDPGVKDIAENSEDFMMKLKDFERERSILPQPRVQSDSGSGSMKMIMCNNTIETLSGDVIYYVKHLVKEFPSTKYDFLMSIGGCILKSAEYQINDGKSTVLYAPLQDVPIMKSEIVIQEPFTLVLGQQK